MIPVRSLWYAIVWGMAILVITLLPSSNIPEMPQWGFSIDKIVHFAIFGILTILILKGYNKNNSTLYLKNVVLVVTFSMLYGLLLETAQNYVPGRNFSWPDTAANGFGSIVGAMVFWAFVKFRS